MKRIELLCVAIAISCTPKTSEPPNEKTDSVAVTTEEKPADSKTEFVTIVGNDIWVRDKPATGEVIIKLNDGDRCEFRRRKYHFEVIRGKADYWYLIKYNGKEGWVFGSQTDWKMKEINPRISSSTSIRAAFGYNEAEMCVSY